MRAISLALVALVALSSGACGFHLRGGTTASDVGAVQLTSLHTLAATPFVLRALEQAGAHVVDERASASVVVELLEEKFSSQTVSYTDQARTAEYEVTLTLDFRASRANGDELIPDRRMRASRVYRLDRNNLPGSSQQAELLRNEMTMDLAEQIVRTVGAANRNAPATPAKAAGS